jgi:hypothetical protein
VGCTPNLGASCLLDASLSFKEGFIFFNTANYVLCRSSVMVLDRVHAAPTSLPYKNYGLLVCTLVLVPLLFSDYLSFGHCNSDRDFATVADLSLVPPVLIFRSALGDK